MKTYPILTILAAALALNGCAGYEEAVPQSGTQIQGSDPDAVIAAAEPLSRTALDISRNVVWTSGDQIRIFGASVPGGTVYVTASNNTRTGIFTPQGAQQAVDDATRYAVYPAAAVSGTLSEQTVELDFAALATQSCTRSLGAGSDIARLPMVAVSENNAFLFRNVCGGIQLQLNDYQALGLKIKSLAVTALGEEQIAGRAVVDIATGTAVLQKGGERRTVTVECGEGVDISSDGDLSKGTGFVVFLPAATYEGFRFTVTDTEGCCYEVETKQAVSVTAGVVTPLQTLPLTRYYGTANCYRTAGAGTVEIDVTPYYTFGGDFVHEGRRCVDAAGAATGIPVKAKVVWQQTGSNESGEVVSAPTLDGTTLKVPATGKTGNAVVAVCDNGDVILWSYHIWVSEAADISYNYPERGAYKLLDRNLGATSTELKNRNSYGVFYQWGRKDPFARNLTSERPGGSPYESAASDLEKTAEATAETGTIAYAVRNPQTRLLSATGWYHGAGGNDRLWGWIDSKSGVKSVYDPCPAGYRVADYSCFAEFPADDKGNCNAQYGHRIATGTGSSSYYPTGGYLHQNKDALMYLEYRGYLWNNQPGTGSGDPNRLMYNNAGVTINKGEVHSAGMPVRCLKIE